jgi:hypothetical protein
MRKFALILTGFLVDLTGAEVAPGVWKAEAGKPEPTIFFIAAGIESRLFRKSVKQNSPSDMEV